jgi:protein-disulfide isomerase
MRRNVVENQRHVFQGPVRANARATPPGIIRLIYIKVRNSIRDVTIIEGCIGRYPLTHREAPIERAVIKNQSFLSKRGHPLKRTRREFFRWTAVLILTVFCLVLPGLIVPASAQTPTPEDLAQAGPEGDIVLGTDNAPVTIIEYASMTCTHCAHFSTTTFPELKKRYIDTGKVRFIMREFPLDPLAAAGFMLARCAGADKYMPLVEVLFAKQQEWAVNKPLDPLLEVVKQFGFTKESFDACLKNQKVFVGIEWVRKRASEQLGVTATPTFFVNGTMHRGAIESDELDKLIQPYLEKQ